MQHSYCSPGYKFVNPRDKFENHFIEESMQHFLIKIGDDVTGTVITVSTLLLNKQS